MYAKLNLYLAAILVFAAPALAGGNHDHSVTPAADESHAHADEGSGITLTQWTDQMELFMEYPVAAVGDHGRFIIHLTVLDGFQPVREGTVTLSFTAPGGTASQVIADELLREGIFAPAVTLDEPGRYELSLAYAGSLATSKFVIDDFVVYRSAEHIPDSGSAVPEDGISFLKEQQWKVPFETAEVSSREVQRSVRAIGEILPAASSYVEIVAPVNGVVQVGDSDELALPGSRVARGDVVTRIIPPVQGNGWAASEIALAQAKRNYERAHRLREKDAISQREFEEAENEYRARRAGHERLQGSGEDGLLKLTAPIDGQIIDWRITPGQRVEAGDRLMAIADPSVVWLKANVYESDFRELGTPTGLFVVTGGDDGGWMVPPSSLRVLTTGGALNPVTRTVPVLFEVDNADGRLTVNGSTPVELVTSEGTEAIAIPVSAIYEDEGLAMVFVQTGGESFEKRVVDLGPRHAGWVSVLDGLLMGERVVIRGGYHVKLASTSAAIGAGHAH